MPIPDTVRALLAATEPPPPDPQSPNRIAARVAWVSETTHRLRLAQRRADRAWMRLVREAEEAGWDEEEDDDLPPPPEQAEVDALWDALRAVANHDRWPRELYWSL